MPFETLPEPMAEYKKFFKSDELLGGIDVSYYMTPYDEGKPTIVFLHSLLMSATLFQNQFKDPKYLDNANLIAVDAFGHGDTQCNSTRWDMWDNAKMVLSLLNELKIPKCVVVGVSGGANVAACMAMMDKKMIVGILFFNASMDAETQRSRDLKCWDAPKLLTPWIEKFNYPEVNEDFEVPYEFCKLRIDVGFSIEFPQVDREYFIAEIRRCYAGEAGRHRLWRSAMELRDRESLHSRLAEVVCPVFWMHGTGPSTFSIDNARVEILMFKNARDTRLQPLPGSQHMLAERHAQIVDELIVDFAEKWTKHF